MSEISGDDISKKIIKNTAYNAMGQMWGFIITLALTPYIIRHIGMERFGVLSIIGVITGYFGLFDFGLATSYVKFIAEYFTKKEYGKINRLVSTGLVFYFLFTVIIVTLGFFSMGWILKVLKIPPDLRKEVVFVFFTGIALFGCSSLMGAFTAIQVGLQRMEITNRVAIITSLISALGAVFVLKNGYGLCGLMVNNIASFAISSIVSIFIAFRILPELKLGINYVDKDMLKRLFNFGYKMQVSRISEIVVFQTDRLLIGCFLGIGLVGFYQLGATIIQQARQIPLLLLSALIPAASEIDARADHGKMQELYHRGSKYLMFVSYPIMLFVAASANIIMKIWIGPGYERSAFVIQILSLGYLVNLTTGVGAAIVAAKEKLEYQVEASIATMVSAIVLSVAMVLTIGFYGIAIAASIALIIGQVYFFIKLHKLLKTPKKIFIKKVLLPPFFGTILPAVMIYFLNIYLSHVIFAGKRVNLLIFFGEFIVFTSIYLGIVLKSGYFDEYDRNLIKRHFYKRRRTL